MSLKPKFHCWVFYAIGVILLTCGFVDSPTVPAKNFSNSTSDTFQATRDAPVPEFPDAALDRVLVKVAPANLEAALKRAENTGAFQVFKRKKLAVSDWHVVHVKGHRGVKDVVEKLRADPDILYAEPDYRVRSSGTQTFPNDPSFAQLWGMNNTGQTGGTPDADIDAPEAWSIVTSSPVIVAVIDTGIDRNHQDLAPNMWVNQTELDGLPNVDDDGNGYVDDYYGWDFAYGDNDPMDGKDHGTHCAGSIGAVGNNGIGVVGVCWNIKLMSVKFLDDAGDGWISDAIDAIDYAVSMGAKVLNNSWEGGSYTQALKDAIDAANAAGVVFVAAAGNSGVNNDITPTYPASYTCPNIIAVAATTSTDSLASFSCYGATSVDLAAPGVGILSTTLGNAYSSKQGTSMAAPHVSGACALLWGSNPEFSNSMVKTLLLRSVDPVPGLSGKCVTGGRLNLANSLERMLTVKSAPISGVTIMGTHTGTTEYTAELLHGDSVTLIAPSTAGADIPFGNWRLNGVVQPLGQQTLSFDIISDTTCVAEYPSTTVSVVTSFYKTTPFTGGTQITGSRPGTTQYSFKTTDGVATTLIAPLTTYIPSDDAGRVGTWRKWLRSGAASVSSRTLTFTVSGDTTCQANLRAVNITVTLQSTPFTGVSVTGISVLDSGTANYRSVKNWYSAATYSVSVPMTVTNGGTAYQLRRWILNSTAQSDCQTTLAFTLPYSPNIAPAPLAVAEYGVRRFLSISSTPMNGVPIGGTFPITTDCSLDIAEGVHVEMTAPAIYADSDTDYVFVKWLLNGIPQSEGAATVEFTISGDVTATAEYEIVKRILQVQSSGVEPVAIGGTASGNTSYTTQVDDNSTITLIAPSNVVTGGADYSFVKWTLNGSAGGNGQTILSFVINADAIAVAEYTRLARKGDFDGNGAVDFSDFIAFVDVYGLADDDLNWDPNGPIGDFDDSGNVGFGDFIQFITVYGT